MKILSNYHKGNNYHNPFESSITNQSKRWYVSGPSSVLLVIILVHFAKFFTKISAPQIYTKYSGKLPYQTVFNKRKVFIGLFLFNTKGNDWICLAKSIVINHFLHSFYVIHSLLLADFFLGRNESRIHYYKPYLSILTLET